MTESMETGAAQSRPELIEVAETVARDKGIDREEVLEAMEQAIQKAGRSKYGHENDIRATINEETSILSTQDQRFVDKLIFWVDEKEEGGTVVDARKEQKRIQETQALGKPITEGKTPEVKIKRGTKGLLNF